MAVESRDLERAVEILDEDGWTQGYLGNKAVGFCAVGAVRQAMRERNGTSLSITNEVEEATGMRNWKAKVRIVPGAAPVEVAGIIGFNDSPARTKQEVQDVLIKGAKTLRDRGL